MEFGTDLIGNLRQRLGTASSADGSDVVLLDWPGLHARLAAAYEARLELLRGEISSPIPRGSFDRGAAALLGAPGYSSHLVNPADLANGKVQSPMEADFTEPNVGDQGK